MEEEGEDGPEKFGVSERRKEWAGPGVRVDKQFISGMK